MLKDKMLTISIFCLAISIVISAFIVSKGLKNNGDYVRAGLTDIGYGVRNISGNLSTYNANQVIPKDNFSLPEAAIYLKISDTKLIQLVENKGSLIPYVKIGNDYIFNKNALDKWLETAKIEVQ